MALSKNKFSELPSDAVILNEDEAIKYQLDIVKGWKNKKDVWILNYGYTILSSLSALNAVFINNHYRHKLRLLQYGRFSSYLSVVALPSLASGLFHHQFVVSNVLIQKSCPVCIELRAVVFQTILGTIFPAILAPLAAMPFAIRYNTYPVPPITSETRKLYQMLIRHTKPIGKILLGIMLVQGLAASFITYKEMDAVSNIQNKLITLEKELIEKYGDSY